jgi:hypothetical protein
MLDVSAEVLKYWIDCTSLSLSLNPKIFQILWIHENSNCKLSSITYMYDFICILFICLFVCLIWCSILVLRFWVNFLHLVTPKKKGGEGALTRTKVIIVWPYLAKSSSCGWSSPVHLPTKWGEKKNPDDDDDDDGGKCNDKILYSYIVHIVQNQCGFNVFCLC